MKEKFEKMKQEYSSNKNIEIQTDFSSNDTVFNADLIITDWSGIGFEYAFTTKKPVLYIDTPMKIMNPNYKDIDVVPINIWSRNEIGKSLKVEELDKIKSTIKELLDSKDKYKEKINKLYKEYVYNPGKSAEVGAEYIINYIVEKTNEKKKKQK